MALFLKHLYYYVMLLETGNYCLYSQVCSTSREKNG